MPIYEYFCKSCDDKFEVRQSASQMTLVADCPEGHHGAKKVLSMFATVVNTSDAACATGACETPMGAAGCGADSCCMSMN